MREATIEAQCDRCGGTGLYHGFAEPPGVGVVCLGCKGTGKGLHKHTPFTGRVTRSDIHTVRRSQGSLLVTGVGPTGSSISYQDFKNGRLP